MEKKAGIKDDWEGIDYVPLDLNGLKKKSCIHDALLQHLVDDAIRENIKHPYNKIASYGCFQSSSILWVFDPSLEENDGWKKHILNEPMHFAPDIRNKALFHHNKTQFTIASLDESLENATKGEEACDFMIKTMDCFTGHVTTTQFGNWDEDIFANHKLAPRLQDNNFRGMIDFPIRENGDTDKLISYDVKNSRWMAGITVTFEFYLVIDLPIHNSLYLLDHHDNFLQYEDNGWKKRAPPSPECDFSTSVCHLIHQHFLYLFGRDDKWQRYDIEKDQWTMMASRKKISSSYKMCAAIVDDVIYLFCLTPCKRRCIDTYNLHQPIDTGVWNELEMIPEFYGDNDTGIYTNMFATTCSV